MNTKLVVMTIALGCSGVSMAQPFAMSVDEAAAWLRVPQAEVELLAERGELPGRRFDSAGWRFDPKALRAWLARADATAQPSDVSPTVEVHVDSDTHVLARVAQEPMPNGRSSMATAEETALRSVLLTGGLGDVTLEFDLAHHYDDSGSGSLALFGGRQESRTTTATLGLSYRLNERTQLFAQLPYASQRTKSEDLVAGELVRGHQDGLQSLSFGVRRVLLSEDMGRPQVTASLEVSSPMKSSLSNRLALELAVIKSLDPVSVFASLRADQDFGDDKGIAQRRVKLGLGYVYALNEMLAVSTVLNISDEEIQDATGLGWRHQSRYELKLGMPASFNHSGWFIEPSLSFGLNDADSSVTVGVSLVKTFAR